MEYEYKSIMLEKEYDPYRLNEDHSNILNEYFKENWEYVDNITQPLTGGGNFLTRSAIIVILRKKKETINL